MSDDDLLQIVAHNHFIIAPISWLSHTARVPESRSMFGHGEHYNKGAGQ